ncbi:glycosyltransferase family 4 protein [Hymenobacter sp. BRD67]|uniref:glycosyltransferase family 4 protein n=1 Tax=Hymenobacter sp. BRD67 TaxID=2675877 RepID=UPI00156697ED|nr:glycosyltransferase family 4 protein [Hymenobacter sp. BRD67]QKG52102.1 glycosyltransferase [Hymenobacter sp. BRD67]
MHILQLCPRVPYPPHDGGAIAMYETARGLAQAGHRVTVLAANTPKHYQPADALAHLGPNVRLVVVDVDTRIRPLVALKNLLFSRQPYNIERFVSPDLLAGLLEVLRQESVDIIQFEGTQVAPYLGLLHQAAADTQLRLPPLVLRAHNIEYTIWQMLAARAGNPLKKWYLQELSGRLAQYERAELPRFSAVAAITEQDAQRLRSMGCEAPITFIPASFDLSRWQPAAAPPQPRTLFVIGSLNWLPNLEGLDWFLREVWPQAHAELPELELHIAGSHPPATLVGRAPGQDNVYVHGFVASAAAFMQHYELMLVPLLSGGGMRVKLVEGLALGKPVLSTTLGAEGIAARNDENMLLRDGAAAWQQALRDYYHGRLPLAALGREAARTAHAEYDTCQVTQRLTDLYRQVLGPPVRPGTLAATPQ